MEHYVEKKGNVWVPRQEPINGRNIGHKVVCERLGAYEASEMAPGAVIAMKRACGGKTAAEIEELVQAESEGRLVVLPENLSAEDQVEYFGIVDGQVKTIGRTDCIWAKPFLERLRDKKAFLTPGAALAAMEGEREAQEGKSK